MITKKPDKIQNLYNPDDNEMNKYNAKVFCLSCHYSHASKFDNSVRWDNKTSSVGCYECHNINSLE
jgi:predicted CXXCH cytochrome family protein